MMRQISPKIWISVIVVVVLAVGLAIFFAWPKEEKVPETVTPEVTPGEEEVTHEIPADWKTYRNEEYGFEVKYPVGKGWVEEPMLGPLGQPNILYFGPDGPYDEMIVLSIEDINEGQEEYVPYPPEQAKEWKREEMTINNYRAIRYESEGEVERLRGVEGPFRYKTVIVSLDYEGKRYILRAQHSVEFPEVFENFERMLVSLKFPD